MNVLVTGGAGYIGSHTVRELIEAGHAVCVVDDLSTGHRKAVDPNAKFFLVNTGETERLTAIMKDEKIEAVFHFAANIEVGESVLDPGKYYENNFSNTIRLFSAMEKCTVRKLIFSSTAAVYGEPRVVPVHENQPLRPINPYGRSKMMVEMAIEDFSKAHAWSYTILRYFNVAGAHPDGSMGEDHFPESHLLPRILEMVDEGRSMTVFGVDYPTPDGTCIRDYVHVVDLARAHILALNGMEQGRGDIYNVGSKNGFSVREVIAACEKVTGKRIDTIAKARRSGDPAILVANSDKIRTRLKWKCDYPDLETMVTHAWAWKQRQ